MATSFTALADANVLYSSLVRDLVIRLAQAGVFRVRWSEAINDEWIRSLLRQRPDLDEAKLRRLSAKMADAVMDAVVSGYEPLMEGLTLPDPDDRHVLAAAIKAGAGVIVTFNVKDFPEHVLRPYGMKSQHPDDFLIHQLTLDHGHVIGALRVMRASFKNPPYEWPELLDRLTASGLVRTATNLRDLYAAGGLP
jgi:predicted nucleic acid-binding protein